VELRQIDVAASAISGAPFDVVLANLTGGLLMRQARTLRSLTSSGGALIVSGIEAHEADEVAAAFAHAGCSVAERADEAGWVGLRLR
jgi:ribosomal protein L11 methyltransferase